MPSLKALTNRYNDMRSQRIQQEGRLKTMRQYEQDAANELAVEVARRDGVVAKGQVFVRFFGEKTAVYVLRITGWGHGKYKVRVALLRKDGQPSSRFYSYTREELLLERPVTEGVE